MVFAKWAARSLPNYESVPAFQSMVKLKSNLKQKENKKLSEHNASLAKVCSLAFKSSSDWICGILDMTKVGKT